MYDMEPETIMVREQGLSTREARAPIRSPRGHAQQVSREYCSPGGHDGSGDASLDGNAPTGSIYAMHHECGGPPSAFGILRLRDNHKHVTINRHLNFAKF
jgi:hypothetical protein